MMFQLRPGSSLSKGLRSAPRSSSPCSPEFTTCSRWASDCARLRPPGPAPPPSQLTPQSSQATIESSHCMALRLFNTLSGKLEEFRPLEDSLVRMYSCGPTVYDYGHIGNFRTFIFVDLLRRYLRQSGYKLRHVMNITDVDDKIIRNAARDRVSVEEYTAKYIAAFRADMRNLNIETPEELPRATQHIPRMADLIEGLVRAGFAYRTADGSYYFRV